MADVTITVDRAILKAALAFGVEGGHYAAEKVWALVPKIRPEAHALQEVLSTMSEEGCEILVNRLADNGWKLVAIGSEDDVDSTHYNRCKQESTCDLTASSHYHAYGKIITI